MILRILLHLENMATTVWRDIEVSFRHPIPLYTILALSLRSVAPFHHVKFSDIWGPNGVYQPTQPRQPP